MTQALDVDALDQRIAGARHRRDNLEREARDYARERDELNEQFHRFKGEIRTLKEKRDELNLRVRELKEKREEARRRVVEIREKIEATKKRIEDLRKKAEGGYSVLKKRIDALEWKIQTSSLTSKEETRLIAQMKILASQLRVHEKVRELKDKTILLQAELGGNRFKATEAHEQLSELAQQSEEYHQRMMQMVGQASELKENADKTHAAFVESRRKADAEHTEYVQVKETRDKVVIEAQADRVRKEREIKQRIEDAAEGKLKKGGKLSLDEFRALVEKGSV